MKAIKKNTDIEEIYNEIAEEHEQIHYFRMERQYHSNKEASYFKISELLKKLEEVDDLKDENIVVESGEKERAEIIKLGVPFKKQNTKFKSLSQMLEDSTSQKITNINLK